MSKIKFSDGIPEYRIAEAKPGEYLTRTCGECERCKPNYKKPGWHCGCHGNDGPLTPETNACEAFWDKEAQKESDRQRKAVIATWRKALWAVYKSKDPVTLQWEDDGHGYLPKCPICGELTTNTVQCYWCGQHFIQDEMVAEYKDPELEEWLDCPICGEKGSLYGHRSRRTGLFHGRCVLCDYVETE